MIKINLLPTKRKPQKKLTELQQQLIIAVLILSLVVGGMVFFWTSWTSTIYDLLAQEAEMKAKERTQTKLLTDVKNVEEERKKVNDKIGIIEQLKKNQVGPVRLLDELSRSMPKGLNFTALTEKDGQVSIEGTAFTNNEVVTFINNLKNNRYFTDVFLEQTKQAKSDRMDVYLYKLNLKFKGEQ